jgi:hypothetical protein
VHLRNILDAMMVRLVHGNHRDPTTDQEKANLLAQGKGYRRVHLLEARTPSWPGLALQVGFTRLAAL